MSRPEELLEQLAGLSREDEALHTALERRAKHPGGERDAMLEHVPELLVEPLAERRQVALADAIQARLAADNAALEEPRANQLERAKSGIEPRARRRRSVALGGSAIVALAAGVLLWVSQPDDPATPFPIYDAEVAGDRQSERGSTLPKTTLELRPGSKLDFALRPRTDFGETVRARAFAGSASGERFELELVQEQSSAGALKLVARVPNALPERGELVVIVGRESTLEELGEASPQPGARDPQRFSWSFVRAP